MLFISRSALRSVAVSRKFSVGVCSTPKKLVASHRGVSSLGMGGSDLANHSSFRFKNGNQGSMIYRSFSSPSPPIDFKPKPPESLNLEMAKGIQQTNMLFIRHGVGKQRLELIAKDDTIPLTMKWQIMMETYLTCQLHVVSGLGFSADEQGLMYYTQKLGQFIQTCSPDEQEEFRTVGRETWREMLTIAFNLEDILIEKFLKPKDDGGGEMSIVDARNIIHQVASQLVEPRILEMVATRCSQLPPGACCLK